MTRDSDGPSMDRAPTASAVLTPPDDAVAPQPHPDAPPRGSALGPHFANCFGCGADHPGGLHLRFVVGEGVSVSAPLRVSPDHAGYPGLAHGGLLTTALDECQGTLMWLLRRPAVTARLEVDFLAPVPIGSDLIVSGRCVAVAGRKVYTTAQAQFADGTVAVRAAGLFVVVAEDHLRAFRDGGTSDAEVNP